MRCQGNGRTRLLVVVHDGSDYITVCQVPPNVQESGPEALSKTHAIIARTAVTWSASGAALGVAM
jgi:hypothetical protein